eukprot:2646-Heterococcus_DN1.PRE.1
MCIYAGVAIGASSLLSAVLVCAYTACYCAAQYIYCALPCVFRLCLKDSSHDSGFVWQHSTANGQTAVHGGKSLHEQSVVSLCYYGYFRISAGNSALCNALCNYLHFENVFSDAVQ